MASLLSREQLCRKIGNHLRSLSLVAVNMATQPSHSQFGKKLLYVVDPDKNVGDRYVAKLGQYYDVRTDWVGESEVFNDFVDWYTKGCT